MEHARRRRIRHQDEPGRIKQRPADQCAQRAEAVRDRAGEWLADAVEQVLDRDCESEHIAPPAELLTHWLKEESERRTGTEREDRNEATAHEDDSGCAPAKRLSRRGRRRHVTSPLSRRK